MSQPFPPPGPATTGWVATQRSWGARIYKQFSDDDDLNAFVDIYNEIATEYLDWFQNTELPVYTRTPIFGPLLDWVATGIYGFPRPAFATPPEVVGELGQLMLCEVEVAGAKQISAGTPYLATDDEYKRCLTWQFYKGDGFQFSVRWLKRRIQRFLLGVNGRTPNIDETYEVSVTPHTNYFKIVLHSGGNPEAPFLIAAINARAIALPFQWNFLASGS